MHEPSVTSDFEADLANAETEFESSFDKELDWDASISNKESSSDGSGGGVLAKWLGRRNAFSGKTKASIAGLWIAVVLIFSFGLPTVSTEETDHPNWQHITDVKNHNEELQSQGRPNQLKQLNYGQSPLWAEAVGIGREDLDTETTKSVRAAIVDGDHELAEQLLQDAQQVDAGKRKSATDYEPPRLTQGMADAVARGEEDFYHLYLYDCCAQDGDVVRIELNGVPYATIPLTHTGTTLSVPVGTGTTIGLCGVRDGGGGITVSCRTSQGDHFTSPIMPGQVQTVAVVR